MPKSVAGFGVWDKAKWAKADKVGAVPCSVQVLVTRCGRLRKRERKRDGWSEKRERKRKSEEKNMVRIFGEIKRKS